MLRIRDVRKSYGSVQALRGVDLDVEPGEVVALLGPNGAGKTTLASIVAGLRRADSGQVWVNGVETGRNPRLARQGLGFAPQETGIYPSLSVRENLRFFGELAGLRRELLSRRVSEVAEAFSLAHLLDRKGQELSGGEARRLHTAVVVIPSPPLLLLDEPTVGVDVETRNQLVSLIRSLADNGAAVVYSTHYLSEVEQLDVSTVAILVEGEIVASDSIPNLVSARGGASVELRFDGEPPALNLPEGTVLVGEDRLRVPAVESPAITAVSLLQALNGDAHAVREIKLIQPSLESVFLSITSKGSTVGEGAAAP